MATARRQSRPYFTPEEYLKLERPAEFRSEYFAGEIVAMAGASLQHCRIVTNISWRLGSQLAERPCDCFTNGMRVRVEAPDIYYTYPDVAALCGTPRFHGDFQDCLINPRVIVEVLSPSIKTYDRESKFALYRQIESLTDYLMISQDEVRIEHHTRQGPVQWLLTEYKSLEDSFFIASIGCTLRLADIYLKVEFPPAQDGPRAGGDPEPRR